MEDLVVDQIVKKDSLLKRILKKIKCKLVCCSHSSCSYNEDEAHNAS